MKRPELKQLKKVGYEFDNPWEVVDIFEKKVAKFAGSRYAVATDCCTHAIFLSLMYHREINKCLSCINFDNEHGCVCADECIDFNQYYNGTITITIPKHTYFSVPMLIKQAGFEVQFRDNKWDDGGYWLEETGIWDGAVRWREGMYICGLHCLSFQIKKNIPIGRGGMILTDDFKAYEELKLMRYDGRDMNTDRMDKNHIKRSGYHMYMTPEDAARGILLMEHTGDMPDSYTWKDYPDLTINYESINYRD